jgi:hypothetical protein
MPWGWGLFRDGDVPAKPKQPGVNRGRRRGMTQRAGRKPRKNRRKP